MFGCLRKIGCLFFLIVAAIAVWLFIKKPEVIDKVFKRKSAAADLAASPDWQLLTEQSARNGESAIASLNDNSGPAYVRLSAGDAASYIFLKAAKQLPPSAQGAAAKLDGDKMLVKADIALGEMGKSVLGPLATFLPERDTLILGGRLVVTSPGRAQFQVTDVHFGKMSIPQPMIPKLISKIRKNTTPADSVPPDAFSVKLPSQIGDVRVGNNQITLYKAEQR